MKESDASLLVILPFAKGKVLNLFSFSPINTYKEQLGIQRLITTNTLLQKGVPTFFFNKPNMNFP